MRKSTIALALGTLGLGMSEFTMMGILPDIAKNLNISITQAGHLISAYAMGVVIGAPMLVLIARKLPLKKVLLGVVIIYNIENFLFSFTSRYEVNLIFRLIAGLPHGAYFGVGSIVAEKLAKEGKGTSAVAGMISGMTIANLIGVPLGTFISHYFSWSITYIIIASIGALIFYCIKVWIPELQPLPDQGFKGQFKFLKKLNPWLIIIATIMGNGGIFCWYSYVNPMMTTVVGFSTESMTGVMIFAGLGMVLGNLISGRLSDKYSPQKIGTITQGLAAITLLSIYLSTNSMAISLILMFIGTGCLFAVSAPQQFLLLKNAPGGEMLAGAMIQVAFNIGNAVGAYLGGIPINKGYSCEYSALPGIVLCITGFLSFLCYSLRQKYTHSFSEIE